MDLRGHLHHCCVHCADSSSRPLLHFQVLRFLIGGNVYATNALTGSHQSTGFFLFSNPFACNLLDRPVYRFACSCPPAAAAQKGTKCGARESCQSSIACSHASGWPDGWKRPWGTPRVEDERRRCSLAWRTMLLVNGYHASTSLRMFVVDVACCKQVSEPAFESYVPIFYMHSQGLNYQLSLLPFARTATAQDTQNLRHWLFCASVPSNYQWTSVESHKTTASGGAGFNMLPTPTHASKDVP